VFPLQLSSEAGGGAQAIAERPEPGEIQGAQKQMLASDSLFCLSCGDLHRFHLFQTHAIEPQPGHQLA
jgi:hypothetical protein